MKKCGALINNLTLFLSAKATLEILVPELAELWNEKNPVNKQKNELGSDIKVYLM